MKILSAIFFIMITSGYAYAECRRSNGGPFETGGGVYLNVTLGGPYSLAADAPNGTIITRQVVSSIISDIIFCDAAASWVVPEYWLLYSSSKSTTVANAYNTNVRGVGIRAYETGFPDRFFSTPKLQLARISTPYTVNSPSVTVELVKTGDITPGVLRTGNIVSYAFEAGSGGFTATTITLVSGTQINTVGCTVTNGVSQIIQLDNVFATELANVGTTANPKNFNIDLSCDSNAKVSAELKGTQDPNTAVNLGVLQVSNPEAADTAKGVGIQFLSNDSPMPLNTVIELRSSASGNISLPFAARYYQTLPTVTAGIANTSATINLSYP